MCSCFINSTFHRGSGLELVAFSGSNYVSKAKTEASVSIGVATYLGACVCGFSNTQMCVTLSSTDGEYVAMADTTKEVICMRYV